MQNSECTVRRTPTAWRRAACRALPAFFILNSALLAGCLRPERPADPNIITIAARVGPNNLHPLKANDEGTARVGQLMYDTLMDTGDDLRAHPRLAERLERPDPLTCVVHLGRGVKFHDGRKLTARDVVHTYSLFLDPAFVSPFKGAFTPMTGVRAMDDYTVAITLKAPFPSFPVTNIVPIPISPSGVDEPTVAPALYGTAPCR